MDVMKGSVGCISFNHKEGPKMPEHNLNRQQPTLAVAV